jgi:hypothetical protein
VSLSAAALAANASCTFSVNVTATGSGPQNNVTGAVTSTEGGTGGTATASLLIAVRPAESIPTLHEWLLLMLGLLLAASAAMTIRRRR